MGIGKTNEINTLPAAPSAAVAETTADATYYVRTDGNDSNTGLADTPEGALLTIQAAIGKIARYTKHTITINVKEGNFGGFRLCGFMQGGDGAGSIVIQGTLGDATLQTGTTSGTATGGSTTQLVDSGQTWTANDLRGKYICISGVYRLCRNNDGTTINLVGAFSTTCSGKTYTIVEHKTIINSSGGSDSGYRIYITSNVGQARDTTLLNPHIKLLNLKVDGGTYGIEAIYTDGIHVERCGCVNSTSSATFLFQGVTGCLYLYDSFVTDCVFGGVGYAGFVFFKCPAYIRNADRLHVYECTSSGGYGFYYLMNKSCIGSYWCVDDITGDTNTYGVYVAYSDDFSVTPIFISSVSGYGIWSTAGKHTNFGEITIANCGNTGIFIMSPGWVDIDAATITGCSGYGLCLGSNSTAGWTSGKTTLDMSGSSTISNNTLGGIKVTSGSMLRLTTCVGTGNGSYGVVAEDGSLVYITSATTITGSSGEATINGGTTALDWSTDFAGNGDLAINVATNTIIKRVD